MQYCACQNTKRMYKVTLIVNKIHMVTTKSSPDCSEQIILGLGRVHPSYPCSSPGHGSCFILPHLQYRQLGGDDVKSSLWQRRSCFMSPRPWRKHCWNHLMIYVQFPLSSVFPFNRNRRRIRISRRTVFFLNKKNNFFNIRSAF